MNNEAFLIVFLAFMIFMALGPALLRPLKIPSVIALLIIGMFIGPNGIHLLDYLSVWLTFLGGHPETVHDYAENLINSLGSLGLIFLMALAGMEADFKMMSMTKKPVAALSFLTFFVPAVTGFFVYAYFRPDDFAGKLLYASLFASHSVGIVFPIIRELKLTRTKFGAAVLISTVITDIASIVLLAIAVQTKRLSMIATPELSKRTLSIFDYLDPAIFGDYFTPIFLLIVISYIGIALWVVAYTGNKLLNWLKPSEDGIIITILLVVILTLLIGEFIGVNLVVGSFVAGLGLSKIIKSSESNKQVMKKLEAIGYGLLIPFLFVSIGMATDFRTLLHSPSNLTIILLTVIGLVGSKVFSGWLALRLTGFSNSKGFCAGLMTVPQLSATLAAAAIGKELGVLDSNFFNAIVVLSIVTTLPIPTLVRLVIEKTNMQFENIDADQDGDYTVPEEKEEFL
ncbi:cation:proton antiporter [Victivallis sp. Marseille-Q1083]|uniref:cation:proton antiporter n=1 Tax=Victivallis sp. Marseille-Q1083 TaxID=2717288 RepID=UPI00158DE58B|nr:cation:proton antiporter [Victivallis sp. Marseille-Q1083]